MDEAELALRTARLPETFADRLPGDAREALHLMAEGGEWRELLDLLLAVLSQTGTAITTAERGELRDVLASWGLSTAQADGLPAPS